MREGARIVGIGCDLCAVGRMERAIGKAHFTERVFLPGERAYMDGRGRARAQSAAAMFAAKEAAAKALGTGFAQGVMPWTIEVIHGAQGAPQLLLHAEAQARFEALGGARAHLSLSHEGDMAMAMVILEGE